MEKKAGVVSWRAVRAGSGLVRWQGATRHVCAPGGPRVGVGDRRRREIRSPVFLPCSAPSPSPFPLLAPVESLLRWRGIGSFLPKPLAW